MSYTELYVFNKNNTCMFLDEIQNSHRGAMAIWLHLEKKYLPPLSDPYGLIKDYNSRFFCGKVESLKEFWDLFKDKRLTIDERIVLGSTYDNVLVKKENFSKLIKAFRNFEATTSLKEQADLIESIINEPEISAIGWNQTSISDNSWQMYDEEKDEYIPYDLDKCNDHWYLFEELEKEI